MAKHDVAATALFVAAVRARENERHDPLFRDELSSLLAGPEGRAWLRASEANPESNYHRDSFPYLEVRTRHFDDWLHGAVRESNARQLVILGAGMDTRAFRLGWPNDLGFWEVDTKELFSLKEARLHSAGVRVGCDRIVVSADLASKDWPRALLEEGFEKNSPTVWLAEGLFQYLKAKEVYGILEGAASISAPGSRFGAEIISMDHLHTLASRTAMQRRKDRGTPWVFGTNDPDRLFRLHGWTVDQKVGVLEAGIALRRWPLSRVASRSGKSGPPGASFVSAVRKAS